MRPANISDDHTSSAKVVSHAVEWLLANSVNVKYACCIYATAPFISALDLQNSWKLLSEKKYDFVFPITRFSYPIQRAVKLTKNNRVEMFFPENYDKRSQDFPNAWHDAGQFYWGTKNAWLAEKSIFSKNSSVIRLPNSRVQDIDTLEDWSSAELKFKMLREAEKNENSFPR